MLVSRASRAVDSSARPAALHEEPELPRHLNAGSDARWASSIVIAAVAAQQWRRSSGIIVTAAAAASLSRQQLRRRSNGSAAAVSSQQKRQRRSSSGDVAAAAATSQQQQRHHSSGGSTYGSVHVFLSSAPRFRLCNNAAWPYRQQQHSLPAVRVKLSHDYK
ncbi:unnamed protein product [Lampetra fluviatilis]